VQILYGAEAAAAGRPTYGDVWRGLRAGSVAVAAAAGRSGGAAEADTTFGIQPEAAAAAPNAFGDAEVSADGGHLQLAGVRLDGTALAEVPAADGAACR